MAKKAPKAPKGRKKKGPKKIRVLRPSELETLKGGAGPAPIDISHSRRRPSLIDQ